MNLNYNKTDAYKGYSTDEILWKKNKLESHLEYKLDTNRIPYHGEAISSPIYNPPPLIVIPGTAKRARFEDQENLDIVGYFTATEDLYVTSDLFFLEEAIDTIPEPKRTEIRSIIENALNDPIKTQWSPGILPKTGLYYSLESIDLTETDYQPIGSENNCIIIVRGDFTAKNFAIGTTGTKTIIIATGNITMTETTENLSNEIFLFCKGTAIANIVPGYENLLNSFDNFNLPTPIKINLGRIIRRTIFDKYALDQEMTNLRNPITQWFSLVENPENDKTIDLINNQICFQYQISNTTILNPEPNLFYINWDHGFVSVVFLQNNIVPNFGIHTEPYGIKFFIGETNLKMLQTFRQDNSYKPIGIVNEIGPNYAGYYMTLNNKFDISISSEQYAIPGTQTFSEKTLLDSDSIIDETYRKKNSRIHIDNEVFFGSPKISYQRYHPLGSLIQNNEKILLQISFEKRSQIVSFSGNLLETLEEGKKLERNINAYDEPNGTIVYADFTKVLIKHGKEIKEATSTEDAIFSGHRYSYDIETKIVRYFLGGLEQSNGFPRNIILKEPTEEIIPFSISVIFPNFFDGTIMERQITNEENFSFYKKIKQDIEPFFVPTRENTKILPEVKFIDPFFRTQKEKELLFESGFILRSDEILERVFISHEPKFSLIENYYFIIYGRVILDYESGDQYVRIDNLLDGEYISGTQTIQVVNSKVLISSLPFTLGLRVFMGREIPKKSKFDEELSFTSVEEVNNFIKNLNGTPFFTSEYAANYFVKAKAVNNLVTFDAIEVINSQIETKIIFDLGGKKYSLSLAPF